MKKVPRDPTRWKQDTPRMQLILVWQSIWGRVSNMADGTSFPTNENLRKTLRDIEELGQVITHLPEGEWETVADNDCFGCGEYPQKYATGLCEDCHQICMAQCECCR